MSVEHSTIDINALHPSVTERYYTPKYKIDVIKKGEDHKVLIHSNRICIVTLAESHPILLQKKEVMKVDFVIDHKTNRLANKVSGKGKKGAQWLQGESPLCRVTCSDNSVYTIRSCINASLMEVNTRLVNQPGLLHSQPNSAGYVALVLTGLKEHERAIGKLLSQEEYDAAMEARRTNSATKAAPGGNNKTEAGGKGGRVEKKTVPSAEKSAISASEASAEKAEAEKTVASGEKKADAASTETVEKTPSPNKTEITATTTEETTMKTEEKTAASTTQENADTSENAAPSSETDASTMKDSAVVNAPTETLTKDASGVEDVSMAAGDAGSRTEKEDSDEPCMKKAKTDA